MFPKDVHIPIPGTPKSVMLYGRRDFADIIKVQTKTPRECPRSPSGPNLISCTLKSRELPPIGSRREMRQKENQIDSTW